MCMTNIYIDAECIYSFGPRIKQRAGVYLLTEISFELIASEVSEVERSGEGKIGRDLKKKEKR